MVESSALLKRRSPKGYRGFESLPHRHPIFDFRFVVFDCLLPARALRISTFVIRHSCEAGHPSLAGFSNSMLGVDRPRRYSLEIVAGVPSILVKLTVNFSLYVSALS